MVRSIFKMEDCRNNFAEAWIKYDFYDCTHFVYEKQKGF